jgi:hypothetical protein
MNPTHTSAPRSERLKESPNVSEELLRALRSWSFVTLMKKAKSWTLNLDAQGEVW